MIEAPISLLFPSYLWYFPTQKNPFLSLISFYLLAPQDCLLPIFSLICPIRGFRMNLDDIFGVGDKSDYVVVLGDEMSLMIYGLGIVVYEHYCKSCILAFAKKKKKRKAKPKKKENKFG